MPQKEKMNNTPVSPETPSNEGKLGAQKYAQAIVEKQISKIGKLLNLKMSEGLPPDVTLEKINNAGRIHQELLAKEEAVQAGDAKVIKKVLVEEKNKLEDELNYAVSAVDMAKIALTEVTKKWEKAEKLLSQSMVGTDTWKIAKAEAVKSEAKVKDAASDLREKFNYAEKLQKDLVKINEDIKVTAIPAARS